MCQHALHLDRRQFGGLVLGAASVVLAPSLARAAGQIEAMGVTCIDYRLVDDGVRFFDRIGLRGEYDSLSLAGASLAAVSPKFPSSNKAFWDQLQIARDLHHIKKLVIVDHRDCGAYRVAFGEVAPLSLEAETELHRKVMQATKVALAQMHPDLPVEFYLMALNGKAERIDV